MEIPNWSTAHKTTLLYMYCFNCSQQKPTRTPVLNASRQVLLRSWVSHHELGSTAGSVNLSVMHLKGRAAFKGPARGGEGGGGAQKSWSDMEELNGLW